MTFSQRFKEELAAIKITDDTILLPELLGYLAFNSKIIDNKIIFKTKYVFIATRFYQIVKKLYGVEIKIISPLKTDINNYIQIIIEDKVDLIISEIDPYNRYLDENMLLTKHPESKKAFLRACFLVFGSISDPHKSDYHLEIFSPYKNDAIFLQRIINSFDLNSKITTRRKGFIVYLKEANMISNFIKLTGANETLYEFEREKNNRDIKNSVNRLINCEISNQTRTNKKNSRVLKSYRILENVNSNLLEDETIKNIYKILIKNNDFSLSQLAENYFKVYKTTISRSKINRIFLKILNATNNYK